MVKEVNKILQGLSANDDIPPSPQAADPGDVSLR